MKLVFILLVVFQVKHFLADYPLQTRWMLGKFKADWSFFRPLWAHANVHASLTFLVAFATLEVLHPRAETTDEINHILATAFLLGAFDGVVHFIVDRIKASPRYLGRFKTLTADTAKDATPEQWRSNRWFWWTIGLDQAMHHLTHYAIIGWLVAYGRGP